MISKRKCESSDVLRNSLRKLKRTISEAATRFSGYHQHVSDTEVFATDHYSFCLSVARVPQNSEYVLFATLKSS